MCKLFSQNITTLFLALVVHELSADEIGDFEFTIKDADNMVIEDIWLTQWKSDSKFKVIIDLKVSRNKIEVVAEVSFYHSIHCLYHCLYESI